MNFKIKHIATRFFLQSIFTILIIATLIFIMFYSGYRKKDTLQAITIVEEIHSNLVLTNLTFEKAIDMQKADPDFVEVGCDLLIVNQSSIDNEVRASIARLDSIKYLKTLFSKEKSDDSLIVAVNGYTILFSKTLLSLKEKGNQNGGFIKQAVESIQLVSEELELAPDNGLQAAKFKAYTSAYLTDFSYSKLYELINFCDDIVTPLYYLDDYDVFNLENLVTTLRNDLLRIQQIDIRLHDRNNQLGQLLDVSNSYERLINQYDRFTEAIRQETNRYNAFWNWIFTILALLLTAAYVIVMGKFSRTVRDSVKSLHKITISLANGSISDTVSEQGNFEFDAFNRDFKSLFSLLNSRKVFIDHLLNEKFDSELEIKAENDEIGNALIQLREKMLAAQQEQARYDKENNSRRYINEGLAKFADVMRVSSNDISILTDSFIKELVKYIGAMQGGLFLTEENNENKLNLLAAFAFDRKRFLEKTVKIGEGLVGTCAIERKTINLTEIPENYIAIKSGLGDTPPSNILILPVMYEDELVGVIELASLQIFREIEIELAENIASSLASTIIAARTNLKTSQLLKTSQVQAAEMAEQEEEMRQNMEELKATQEESARREEEMQGLLDSIGKSFFVLEYDLSGNIIHVNDRLLSFIEQSVEKVLNKKHQDVFSDESLISMSFIQAIIDNKEPETLIESLNWGSKKYQYTYNFSPVFANNGNVVKVLNIFSINEEKTVS